MTECFVIPDGQQNAYFRQFGKLNRIEPIQLKTGDWILPVRVITMLRKTYIDLDQSFDEAKPGTKERREKRKDVTPAVINYAFATLEELLKFPKRNIEPEDIHDRYKEVMTEPGSKIVPK